MILTIALGIILAGILIAAAPLILIAAGLLMVLVAFYFFPTYTIFGFIALWLVRICEDKEEYDY